MQTSFARIGLALCLILSLWGCSSPEWSYYAMEMGGVAAGYIEVATTPGDSASGDATVIRTEAVVLATLLGRSMDVRISERRELDPVSAEVRFLEFELTNATMRVHSRVRFEGQLAHISSETGGQPRTLDLSPDVLVEDGFFRPHLIADLGHEDAGSKSYRIFEHMRGEIQDVSFTWAGAESLVCANELHDCVVFRAVNRTTGVHSKLWVRKKDARLIRSETPDGTCMVLSTASIKTRLGRADVDDMIFANVDLPLEDFRNISYMKVQARIASAGQWITAEDLNVPGQSFRGTVRGNLIDGVFEIEHSRFDGSDSPPFPVDYSHREELHRFLAPELMIESDAPEIVGHARELTEGAADSWEAALRLSRWVAEEIGENIPGGSALQVFRSREGECGSHSRLMTALCRGAGIPARMVTGCMFTPLRGGSFGQHGWNEVYMGDEIGWIPLDTTVKEIDYVDSGHIRLGTLTSFLPHEMEVLEYRLNNEAR